MIELAGGERRRGRWLSDLIAAAYESQASAVPATDVETVRLSLIGLVGELQAVKARLSAVERELAAVIAHTAGANRE